MELFEYVTAAGELGAVGILGIVVYLFVKGKILSEHSVKKITDTQANHMTDLKSEIKTLRRTVVVELKSMVGLLKQIRDNDRKSKK